MKWTIWISILLLCLTGIGEVQAQNDPVLAGMIAVYTEKAEKELKNQEKVMLMQTTGHIWTKEEVQATTDLQREFNNYLNSFRSIVCYAAQTYGFYYEVSRLTDNMGDFTKQLKRSPANTLAVALSTQRNKIYRELMMNSVEIVNDIRTACLSENKMTEKERMEIVFGIRPKLKTMNTKLQRLTFHRITQFGLHAFQISAFGVIPSDMFQVICNHQAVISEKSADQTVFFVVVIITKTVSSCDIVIFLFKDGWIENRNPFNFSCSQIL